MGDEEPVLLHEPDLMLALLRAAAEGPAGLEDAMARLVALRRQAHESAPEDRAELLRRLAEEARALRAAGALCREAGGALALTPRGKELVAEFPDGVDPTVLMRFPEYRAYIAAIGRAGAGADPRTPANDAGYRAFAEGRPHTDNPHPPDSVDHLAWESGWFEARDEAAARR
jgi:hypothetical protein